MDLVKLFGHRSSVVRYVLRIYDFELISIPWVSLWFSHFNPCSIVIMPRVQIVSEFFFFFQMSGRERSGIFSSPSLIFCQTRRSMHLKPKKRGLVGDPKKRLQNVPRCSYQISSLIIQACCAVFWPNVVWKRSQYIHLKKKKGLYFRFLFNLYLDLFKFKISYDLSEIDFSRHRRLNRYIPNRAGVIWNAKECGVSFSVGLVPTLIWTEFLTKCKWVYQKGTKFFECHIQQPS